MPYYGIVGESHQISAEPWRKASHPEWVELVEARPADTGYVVALNEEGMGIWIKDPTPVKSERDYLLTTNYDPNILQATRMLRVAQRTGASAERISALETWISVLDDYAETLCAIPDTPEFPENVVWPELPVYSGPEN